MILDQITARRSDQPHPQTSTLLSFSFLSLFWRSEFIDFWHHLVCVFANLLEQDGRRVGGHGDAEERAAGGPHSLLGPLHLLQALAVFVTPADGRQVRPAAANVAEEEVAEELE
jgi:hypothetical protein